MHNLCDAIKRKCASQGWYGPDSEGPTWAYQIAENDSRRTRFEFLPASAEQLQASEAILGFSLPAPLREIYTFLANGGFGPAYGLRGVIGGADGAGGTIDGWWQMWMSHFIVGESLQLRPGEEHILDFPLWPSKLVSIISWGCGVQIGLDCSCGHILQVSPVEDGNSFSWLAASLEEYFQRWIQTQEEFYSGPVLRS